MPDEQTPEDTQEYVTLAELDDLETLLEELEEHGIVGVDTTPEIPADLRERMAESGVENVQQIRARLMHLHARLDEDDRDLTISES